MFMLNMNIQASIGEFSTGRNKPTIDGNLHTAAVVPATKEEAVLHETHKRLEPQLSWPADTSPQISPQSAIYYM